MQFSKASFLSNQTKANHVEFIGIKFYNFCYTRYTWVPKDMENNKDY